MTLPTGKQTNKQTNKNKMWYSREAQTALHKPAMLSAITINNNRSVSFSTTASTEITVCKNISSIIANGKIQTDTSNMANNGFLSALLPPSVATLKSNINNSSSNNNNNNNNNNKKKKEMKDTRNPYIRSSTIAKLSLQKKKKKKKKKEKSQAESLHKIFINVLFLLRPTYASHGMSFIDVLDLIC